MSLPKFRGWDKRENTMRDVAVLYFNKGGKVNSIEYWKTPSELKSYHVRNLVLMQSTGLKDKNGVEIYEGDIVNHYWSNEVGESFCHKTVIKNPFDYKVNEAMHLIYADELEILGNIWENPELLEGE